MQCLGHSPKGHPETETTNIGPRQPGVREIHQPRSGAAGAPAFQPHVCPGSGARRRPGLDHLPCPQALAGGQLERILDLEVPLPPASPAEPCKVSAFAPDQWEPRVETSTQAAVRPQVVTEAGLPLAPCLGLSLPRRQRSFLSCPPRTPEPGLLPFGLKRNVKRLAGRLSSDVGPGCASVAWMPESARPPQLGSPARRATHGALSGHPPLAVRPKRLAHSLQWVAVAEGGLRAARPGWREP